MDELIRVRSTKRRDFLNVFLTHSDSVAGNRRSSRGLQHARHRGFYDLTIPCMYVYMYLCVSICIYMYLIICIYVYLCVSMCIYMYLYYVSMYVIYIYI